MMHMTFYWSKEVTLLIDSWRTRTWMGYALTLFACILGAAFYQYLENLRLRLRLKRTPSVQVSASQEPLLRRKAQSSAALLKVAGGVMFGVNAAIGYLLMLAIMSFNGGVFVAVVLGLVIGYLAFRSEDDEISVVVDNPCACA